MCVTACGDLLAEQYKLDIFCFIELSQGLSVANQARETFFKNLNLLHLCLCHKFKHFFGEFISSPVQSYVICKSI